LRDQCFACPLPLHNRPPSPVGEHPVFDFGKTLAGHPYPHNDKLYLGDVKRKVMKSPTIHREFRISVQSGVHHVLVMGENVIGRFKDHLVEVGGKREPRLIETLVNCGDDLRSIQSFTRQYGPPLKNIFVQPGGEFRFTRDDFRAIQGEFRNTWRNLEKEANSSVELLPRFGGKFVFSKGVTTYFAPNLYAYFYADLLTNASIERFRVCQRDDCRHPYFLAGHLRQQFCSDACAEEGKRALKREWWRKHRGASPRAKICDEIG
jgi:hypothetical protein